MTSRVLGQPTLPDDAFDSSTAAVNAAASQGGTRVRLIEPESRLSIEFAHYERNRLDMSDKLRDKEDGRGKHLPDFVPEVRNSECKGAHVGWTDWRLSRRFSNFSRALNRSSRSEENNDRGETYIVTRSNVTTLEERLIDFDDYPSFTDDGESAAVRHNLTSRAR